MGTRNRRTPSCNRCLCPCTEESDLPRVTCEWTGTVFTWSVENAASATMTPPGEFAPVEIELNSSGNASGQIDPSSLPNAGGWWYNFSIQASNVCGTDTCATNCQSVACLIYITYGDESMTVTWVQGGGDATQIIFDGVVQEERTGSIEVAYGPDVADYYRVSVGNNCGSDHVCTTIPKCCAFYNTLVVEISGLLPVYTHECTVTWSNLYGTNTQYRKETISGLDGFNGTYLLPLWMAGVNLFDIGGDYCEIKTYPTNSSVITRVFESSYIYPGEYSTSTGSDKITLVGTPNRTMGWPSVQVVPDSLVNLGGVDFELADPGKGCLAFWNSGVASYERVYTVGATTDTYTGTPPLNGNLFEFDFGITEVAQICKKANYIFHKMNSNSPYLRGMPYCSTADPELDNAYVEMSDWGCGAGASGAVRSGDVGTKTWPFTVNMYYAAL